MKFRGHETFYIRKGWMSKGVKNIEKKPTIFGEKDAMDYFGLGNNMIRSLRYWLQAIGLTIENKKGKRYQELTDIGKIIHKNDPFFEDLGSLYLLHYFLVTNESQATAWYCFFNELNMSEFDREDVIQVFQNYVSMKAGSVALRSLSDDFNCIISTYMPKHKLNTQELSPESNLDCPFGELGLVDWVNKSKKTYKKTTAPLMLLDPYIVLAVIINENCKRDGNNTISMNELLHEKENIGKVFNLDSIALLEVLRKVERLGFIKIIRTAGLDVIELKTDKTFLECIQLYYAQFE